MSYLTIDRAKLFYECAGAGSPPLVFVHGFGCGHDDWRDQVEHFHHNNLTVVCDLRGHGRSDRGPDDCTIEGLGDDIGRLLKRLDLPPAVLAGHSMGCRVVLQTYSAAPSLVAGLILVDGSRLAEGNPQEAKQRARHSIQTARYLNWLKRIFGNMFLKGSDARLSAEIINRATAMPKETGVPLFANLCGWDAGKVESALARVKVPLLLLQSTTMNENMERVSLREGDNTPWLELVKHHAPGAQIEIISGAGHFPMLEKPEAVNQRIAEFLASS